jgi:peptidyl-prolyl cis-trans isomerase C
MRKLIKEPLVQFLIGGLFLYLALAAFGPDSKEDDSYVIPVNDTALLLYLQYQDKAFDTASAKAALSALEADGRKRLEEEYVRDEVMVREAFALGLNDNDEVIRRRLIQKMDFIVQDTSPANETITDAEIESYFSKNKSHYMLDAEATFTHIFFSKERHGEAVAQQMALDLMPRLQKDTIPFEKAGEYGDRFYFLRNYVKRPQSFIADHFGIEMTEALFNNSVQNQWIGPFTSKYGSHLLMVRETQPERTPTLTDTIDTVRSDLLRERRDTARAGAIAKLQEKYRLQYPAAAN